MSWLSSVFSGLTKWWRRNNSGGDVIRNNKALVQRTVTAVVAEVWKLKASGEITANEFAKQLIARVLDPLPDGVEALAAMLVESKVETWCKAMFTLQFSEAQAVDYLMANLVALP